MARPTTSRAASPSTRQTVGKEVDRGRVELVERTVGRNSHALDRKPGESRPYRLVRDKVRQLYLSEKMTSYLQGLEQKYQVVWHVIENRQARN